MTVPVIDEFGRMFHRNSFLKYAIQERIPYINLRKCSTMSDRDGEH